MTVTEAKRESPQSGEARGAAKSQSRRYLVLRTVLDMCSAFALFVGLSLVLSSGPTSASPHQIPNPGMADPAVWTAPGAILGELQHNLPVWQSAAPHHDAVAAWLLLSLAFSIVAALNMALVRHLRQAYANPRKRS
jgi:hypothetical protein